MLKDEAQKLNQERITEENKSKAAAFLAQKQADEARAWYWFLRSHSGQFGLANGDYVDCEANKQLLTGWLESNQLPTTQQSLEQAYQANKQRLAQRPAEEYRRVTDTQQTRVFPQIKSLQAKTPPAYAPFTRDEILSWSKERLRRELAKGPAHTIAINTILAGQN